LSDGAVILLGGPWRGKLLEGGRKLEGQARRGRELGMGGKDAGPQEGDDDLLGGLEKKGET